MNAYCIKTSVDVEQVAFIFDGNRLRPEQTPEEVDMEEVRCPMLQSSHSHLHMSSSGPEVYKLTYSWTGQTSSVLSTKPQLRNPEGGPSREHVLDRGAQLTWYGVEHRL